MSYISPGLLESGSLGKITKIELKNGTIINCKDKFVKIENKSDSARFIVISTPDTVKTGSNRYSTHWNEQRIPERDILKIQMEKSEINTTKTVFLVIGIAAFVAIAYFIVLVVSINNANLK